MSRGHDWRPDAPWWRCSLCGFLAGHDGPPPSDAVLHPLGHEGARGLSCEQWREVQDLAAIREVLES